MGVAPQYRSELAVEDRVGTWRVQAQTALFAAKAAALRPFDLSVSQYAVLLVVASRDGADAASVARTCGVTPQTMSVTVGHLARRGWVRRAEGPSRGASRALTLTPAGAEVLRAADAAACEVERAAAARLADAERESLRTLLARINDEAPHPSIS